MMASAGASSTRRDVKRILPVWGILLAATLAALWVVERAGPRMLERLAYSTPNAREAAMIYRADGLDAWKRCLSRVNQARGTARRLEDSSGMLKADSLAEKAERDLLAARRLDPEIAGVAGPLADLAWWRGRGAESFRWRGEQSIQEKQWEAALGHFTAARAMGLASSEVQEGRLESLLRLERTDDAASLTQSLQSTSQPQSARLWLLIADLRERQGKKPERESALREAVRLAPDNLPAIKALGDFLVRAGRKKDAMAHYARALERVRGDAHLWHRQAILAHELNQPGEAIRCYKAALECSPNSFDLHWELGQLLLRRGEKIQAQPHLRRALELDPGAFAKKDGKI